MQRSVVRIVILASLTCCSGSNPVSSTCSLTDYYGQLMWKATTNWTRDDLEDLLRSTHTSTTQFYSSKPGEGDVLQALMALDPIPNDENITLFYSNNIQVLQYPLDRSLWIPEHICPVMMSSFRLGDLDIAFSDLHNIQPVNPTLQEGNRGTTYFGICPTCTELLYEGSETCICGDYFQPPPSSRGQVARSWLYMQLRYPNVSMSDCHLEQLLAWHQEYPPTPTEIVRNSFICSNFQGNRNPYVDYPELALGIRMNEASCDESVRYSPIGNTTTGNHSGSTKVPVVDQTTAPTDAPVVENTDQGTTTTTTTGGEDSNNIFDNKDETADDSGVMDPCSMLLPGDVYFYSVQSSPSRIGMIPLINLPSGLVLYLSNTYSFVSSTTSVRIGDNYPDLPLIRLILNEEMSQGIPFGYGNNLLHGDAWEVVAKPVTLNGGAYGGDEVFLFCYEEQGAVKVISALTTNGAFQDASLNAIGFGRIVLPEPMDYYVYNGPLFSSTSDYQKALMDPSNWMGFNVLASESLVSGEEMNLRTGGQEDPSSGQVGNFLASNTIGNVWVSLLPVGLSIWLWSPW